MAARSSNPFMARPKKIQDDETTDEVVETSENPLVMSIAKLNTLTEEQKQLFRANGGTTTEN